MTSLKELCDLAGNCLKLTVDVRYQDGHLYKEYIIGEGQNEDNATVHMKSDMMKGTLEMIDTRINAHGNGEMGWGMIWSGVPKWIQSAEVTHFFQTSCGGLGGSAIMAHVVPEKIPLV